MPAEQASIPILDRGFIFGDGVYEVIPVYGGHPFRLEEHLARLDNSLNAIRIKPPMNHLQWSELLADLIKRNGDGDQSIYLQITRGVAKRDHALPSGVAPTILAMSNPLITPSNAEFEAGIKAITAEDNRWQNCHIKATSLLANVLLRQLAIDAEATETLLIRDNKVTEGAASNLFLIEHGTVITPPKSNYLLPGITRDLVLELAIKEKLRTEERDILASELGKADEVWITSSTKEIMPVTSLDGIAVGKGKPGPVWRQVFNAFQAYKEKLRKGQAH